MSNDILFRLILLGIESVVLIPIIITTLILGARKNNGDWIVGSGSVAILYILIATATLLCK
jgi:hypothetical protein